MGPGAGPSVLNTGTGTGTGILAVGPEGPLSPPSEVCGSRVSKGGPRRLARAPLGTSLCLFPSAPRPGGVVFSPSSLRSPPASDRALSSPPPRAPPAPGPQGLPRGEGWAGRDGVGGRALRGRGVSRRGPPPPRHPRGPAGGGLRIASVGPQLRPRGRRPPAPLACNRAGPGEGPCARPVG